MCVSGYAMHMFGGQKRIVRSWSSPSTFMWISGIEFRMPGLSGKHLYQFSHPAGPWKLELLKPGMVAYICDTSTWEAEEGELLPVWDQAKLWLRPFLKPVPILPKWRHELFFRTAMGEGAFHCWVLWVWAHHDKNPLLPQVPEAFPTLLAASDTLCLLIAATSEAIRAGITSFCGCVFRSESRRQGDGGLGVDKEGPKFSPWLSGTTASGPMTVRQNIMTWSMWREVINRRQKKN